MRAEDIEGARKVLGLGVDATGPEIRKAYRELAKKYHPDNEGNVGKFRELVKAYKVISDYVRDYRYSFSFDEVIRQYPQQMWTRSYSKDPIWGVKPQSSSHGGRKSL